MKKIILIMFLSVFAVCQIMFAQKISSADKLYSQGVKYMKTMTVASQKKAISSFIKAKVAFDSQTKKHLCDEQITTCRNIIQKLSIPKTNSKHKSLSPEIPSDTTIGADIPVKEFPEIVETKISVTPSEITIPAKGGKYIEVSVDCNVVEWKVGSCPAWISVTSSSTKLLVKAEKNKDKKNERTGIITIVANGVEAELKVKQLRGGFINAVKHTVKEKIDSLLSK